MLNLQVSRLINASLLCFEDILRVREKSAFVLSKFKFIITMSQESSFNIICWVFIMHNVYNKLPVLVNGCHFLQKKC